MEEGRISLLRETSFLTMHMTINIEHVLSLKDLKHREDAMQRHSIKKSINQNQQTNKGKKNKREVSVNL